MIYFVSDIHLGAGGRDAARRIERRFDAWLDRVADDAEAIFLLGDLFDFWFEYREVAPRGFVRTLGRLAALTDRGVRVVLLTGNHDMWVRDYLSAECGLEVYTAPQEFLLAGRRMLLAHGDNMRIDHLPVLRLMNAVFRSRVLRWLFGWLVHPDWAVRFGRWWSGKSRKSHGPEPEAEGVTAPLVDYARDYHAARPDVDTFVFGHMHVIRDYRDEGFRALFLGEWERQPAFASLDAQGRLTLERFTE